MNKELRARSARYMQFSIYLVTSRSPIPLWNNFQPKIRQILNPREKRKMSQLLMPYFKNKTGICIGGEIFWEFNEYLKHAKQVINVDITPIPAGPPVTPEL
jgi:hypothetical protein